MCQSKRAPTAAQEYLQLIIDNGISLSAFSKLSGVSASVLYRLHSGITKKPRTKNFSRIISSYFNLNLESISKGESNE